MTQKEIVEKLQSIEQILLDYATGGIADKLGYIALRNELTSEPRVRGSLPELITVNRDLTQFWSFIKQKFPTYQERRDYIWAEFSPIIEKFELPSTSPSDETNSTLLSQFDVDHVHQIWTRALERREEDPDGAITVARALLETVCKHILDEHGIPHAEDLELPKLYRLTAQQLNLAPSQHTEQIFRQILGGCQTVVEGLGAARNKLGDAHGRGKLGVTSDVRHAELAVNLSGAMATFLIRTWQSKQN